MAERMRVYFNNGDVDECDLNIWLLQELPRLSGVDKVEVLPSNGRSPLPTLNLERLIRLAIYEALDRTGWVQRDAASLMGISPRRMNYLIRKYGITPPRGRKKNWYRNRKDD